MLELMSTQKELNFLYLDIWKNKITDKSVENVIDTITNKLENNLIEFNINIWEN